MCSTHVILHCDFCLSGGSGLYSPEGIPVRVPDVDTPDSRGTDTLRAYLMLWRAVIFPSY